MSDDKNQKSIELVRRVNLDYQHCKLVDFFVQNKIKS